MTRALLLACAAALALRWARRRWSIQPVHTPCEVCGDQRAVLVGTEEGGVELHPCPACVAEDAPAPLTLA